MEFRDFNVEILGTRDGRFDVRISSRASGELQTDVVLPRSVDALLGVIGTTASTARSATERAFTPETAKDPASAAADVGQALFDMLFAAPETSRALAECMTEAKMGQAGVRLKLTLNTRDAGVADLSRLPWELLHDDSKYKHFGLRPDFPIVRYLEVPKPFEAGRYAPPLRVLAVSANPRHDLALDRERDNLQAALAGNSDIELTCLDQVTIQGLAAELSRARGDGRSVHVVHFMGHGDFHHGRGVLLLHRDGGGEDVVDAEAFATALQAAGDVRLVFLNACNTAQSDASGAADPFSGVAASLVFEGVPAVVAMQRPVPDQAAVVLAKHFYAAIAKGWPVDAALSEGRRQMFFAGPAALDWAIPVLFMRSPDGVLFAAAPTATVAPVSVPVPAPPRPEPTVAAPVATLLAAPRSSRLSWPVIGGALAAVIALAGLGVYLFTAAPTPASMQFLALDRASIATGETLTAHVRLADRNGTPITGRALAAHAPEWTPSVPGLVTITAAPSGADSLDFAATITANRPTPPGTTLTITATLKEPALTDARSLAVTLSEAEKDRFRDAYRAAVRQFESATVDDATVVGAFKALQASSAWLLPFVDAIDDLNDAEKRGARGLAASVTQIEGAAAAVTRAQALEPSAATTPERVAAWDDAALLVDVARPVSPAAAAVRKAQAELRAAAATTPSVVRLATCDASGFRNGVCGQPSTRGAAGAPVYLQVVWRTPPGMRGSDRLRFLWGPVAADGAFTAATTLTMDEFFPAREADRNWWGMVTAGAAGAYELRVMAERQGTFLWRTKVTVQ